KVVYNISKKVFIIRLSYIAIFYTRTIKGIILNESFEIDTLRIRNTKTYIHRTVKIIKHILQ
ncbi:hypothetical protein QR685DRAFT_446608, partial [Neurospora intermedia]